MSGSPVMTDYLFGESIRQQVLCLDPWIMVDHGPYVSGLYASEFGMYLLHLDLYTFLWSCTSDVTGVLRQFKRRCKSGCSNQSPPHLTAGIGRSDLKVKKLDSI